MPTIELPANNVTTVGLTSPATVFGGSSAVATTSTASYVQMSTWTAYNWQLNNGTPDGGGFGLATIPEGGTVTSVKFVALAKRTGGDDIPPGSVDTDFEQDATVYPTLVVEYDGMTRYYNIGPVPEGEFGEVVADIPSSQWKYVIDGHPSAPPGFGGLAPAFFPGPQSYPFPYPTGITLQIGYLAIRVTYELAEEPASAPPVLRVYPRTDGLGASSTPRIWPPPRSRQRSNRATGYL